MKFFPDTIPLSHIIYYFDGYSSQFKIDEMVNNHSNGCKNIQFAKFGHTYVPAKSLMLWP